MIVRHLAAVPPTPVSHDAAILKRVMVGAGEVPRLTNVSVARLGPGQATTPHRHPTMAEVYLVLEGAGSMTVEAEAAALAAGSCLVVEPGELHSLRSEGPGDLVVAYFGVAVDEPEPPRGEG